MNPVVGLALTLLLAGASVADDEQVVLFPTMASPAEGGQVWEVELHGWIYELEARQPLMAAIRKTMGVPDAEDTPEARARYRSRMRLMLADNERGKSIAVRVAGRDVTLPKSGRNGHFHGRVSLPTDALAALPADARLPGERLATRVVLPTSDVRGFDGEVHLIREAGLSVVSDLDDTVKITGVGDHDAMALNTFFRPFRVVPGMAELYRQLAHDHGARFHYLSGSPWQLYRPLRDMLDAAGFPAGSFHLRVMRLKDRSVRVLWEEPDVHKDAALDALFERFPRRRFVLIGDSGEKDARIYARIARLHPDQVAAILIRNVKGDAQAQADCVEAFEGLPAGLWQLFTQPSEIAPAAFAARLKAP